MKWLYFYLLSLPFAVIPLVTQKLAAGPSQSPSVGTIVTSPVFENTGLVTIDQPMELICRPSGQLLSHERYSTEEPLRVDLRNPFYQSWLLSTTEGGVVSGPDLRIQAESIQYVQKDEEDRPTQQIKAKGNLMIQYKGRAYVGSELLYDLTTKTGTLFNGKTSVGVWYVGGEQIELKSDGSYRIRNAFVTCCENKESSWDFYAQKVKLVRNDLIVAKNIQFRLFKIPAFWLPAFKMNLNKFQDPVLRYTIDWDRGQNPRAGVRYQFYSWRDLALYARAEYRLKTGWGGALESEYLPDDKKTTFITRSYVGTDRLETAPNKMFRYRLMGAFQSSTDSDKTRVTLSWDKYTDVRMPSDFPEGDFEVATPKKTLLHLHHGEQNIIASLKVRPRVNAFESLKQDLPTLFITPFPRLIGNTGILSSFSTKLSYLDFTYSDQLAVSLNSYRSARVEIKEKLERLFPLGPLTLIPYLGGDAIFYSASPSGKGPKWLGIGAYGALLSARAQRSFGEHKHIIEPYANLSALTRPTVSPDRHYIFSIQDGLNQINELKVGVRQQLIFQKRPLFAVDLFTYAFYNDPTLPRFFYRLNCNLSYSLPSLYLSSQNSYNFENKTIDYTNNRIEWTFNEHVALAFEARYRSRFDWRKADHDNFILNVSRSESELVLSPLSDRRVTLLGDLFIRFSPFWECHFQAHSGFYRTNQKPYTELKVDLFTWLSTGIKLRISYSHIDLDDRVTAGISVVKK